MNELIFWTTEIAPFKSTGVRTKDMPIVPFAVELKDGRKGFAIGKDWKEELEAHAKIMTEEISKEDLKVNAPGAEQE